MTLFTLFHCSIWNEAHEWPRYITSRKKVRVWICQVSPLCVSLSPTYLQCISITSLLLWGRLSQFHMHMNFSSPCCALYFHFYTVIFLGSFIEKCFHFTQLDKLFNICFKSWNIKWQIKGWMIRVNCCCDTFMYRLFSLVKSPIWWVSEALSSGIKWP